MLVPVLLFLLGFVLLIFGGDRFVDGATGLAHRFHMPELLIGATVVSIGTTLPEVMVSSQAALQGNSGISYGNAIGSIICNTALIQGLAIAVKPGLVNQKALRLPVIFFYLAAIFYSFTVYTAGEFARWQGFVFLAMFVVYMYLSYKSIANGEGEAEEVDYKESSLVMDLVQLIGGAAAIAVGANLLVNNGTLIAQALGVPDSVIGLTVVALGTSLPELITTIQSLLKGHSALGLGNVIGANIFNIVLVSGMAISISPFKVPSEKLFMGMNSSLVIDIPLMLAVMTVLSIPPLLTGKAKRWQGILLLASIVVYWTYQFLF